MVDWIVSTAVEKLKIILEDKVAMLVDIDDEIRKLSSTFTSIQALLEDAESRRVKDRSVKIWLEKVKDVAYDVDDILDEWMTEALKSEVADEGDGSSLSKKRKGFIMQDILLEELQTATKTLELPIPMPATQHDSYDNGDGDDLWCEDRSFYNVSDDGSGKTSDLDREWERRHNQFHTVS